METIEGGVPSCGVKETLVVNGNIHIQNIDISCQLQKNDSSGVITIKEEHIVRRMWTYQGKDEVVTHT